VKLQVMKLLIVLGSMVQYLKAGYFPI